MCKNMETTSYSMYVWTKGFDCTVSGSKSVFLDWDTQNEKYFTHTWDTNEKREWLWATCNNPDRSISVIYLSGVHDALRSAYEANAPAHDDLHLIRRTIVEGHKNTPGLKIYALYAVSDLSVSEQNQVRHVIWYNDFCTESSAERFDGFSLNNEAYAQMKYADNATQIAYLDNLQNVAVESAKQKHGRLFTHFSVGWHWGRSKDNQEIIINWRDTSQHATLHMIDIFDSIDIQVAWTDFPTITQRMKIAGYDYAVATGKQVYANVYTAKESNRRTSFFPLSCDHSMCQSEAAMLAVFDKFSCEGIPAAKPCIHYFRGIYSSGGHPDWPAHKPNQQ